MAASPLGSAIKFARRSQRQLNALLILLVLAGCWHISGLPVSSTLTQHLASTATNNSTPIQPLQDSAASTSASSSAITPPHPIDTLIERAELSFNSLVAKQTDHLASAAAAYRQARGRHPPPGFDVWFKFARDQNAVMVEEFWDQIYHDLKPFWAVPPNQIRADARAFDMVVKVEDGRATSNTGWFWHTIWADLIDTVSSYLPDMVIPLNSMDEPRVIVPWENMSTYVEIERAQRNSTTDQVVVSEYRNWHKDEGEDGITAQPVEWSQATPYSLSRLACAPDSAVRTHRSVPRAEDLLRKANHGQSKHPEDAVDFAEPHSFRGFVANYSLSTNICHQPDLGGMHGALIEPLTKSTTQQLIPLFGGSKFAVNNDILLPAAMYWRDDGRFDAGTDYGPAWNDKESVAIWRGTATGGCNTATNWHSFHRHRFVAMTNGTKYSLTDEYSDKIFSPTLRSRSINALHSTVRKHLVGWLTAINNVAFTDLMCDVPEPGGNCWYTSDEFAIASALQLSQQFQCKYLPDVDGNSFSGRYRAFLHSTSLPIKATLYREWHDSRLIAWKHFVPMDNRFGDFYAIMEYFRGSEGIGGDWGDAVRGHDAAAEKIANEGKEWAEKVLRKADMQIYVLRLLLEYARIADDRRDHLAFVEDLNL